MSALEAASAGVKDMADGSLRITIEFEPRFAKQAFELFGTRGTPLAIAALKTGYAAAGEPVVNKSLTTEKPKGGALSKLAGMWCDKQEFWTWLMLMHFVDAHNSDEAAWAVREFCEVNSRAELDHDLAAAERFNRLIREPFMAYMNERGIVF